MYEKLTDRCRKVFQLGSHFAKKVHNTELTLSDIFMGFCQEEKGIAYVVIKNIVGNPDTLLSRIYNYSVNENSNNTNFSKHISKDITEAVTKSEEYAKNWNHSYIGTEHLLLGIVKTALGRNNWFSELLLEYKLDFPNVYHNVREVLFNTSERSLEKQILDIIAETIPESIRLQKIKDLLTST